MRFEFIDVTHKEMHDLISHGIPRIGDELVLEIKPDIFKPFRIIEVTWFVRSYVGTMTTPIPIPSVMGEEIPTEVNDG